MESLYSGSEFFIEKGENMQITVNIDDMALNSALEKGIQGLSNETITDMAKEALQSYMMDPRNLENMIFSGRVGYSYGYSQPEIRQEIMNALMNSFTEDEIKEYRQKIFETIEKHGDHLLTQTLAQIFTNMLMTESVKNELAVRINSIANRIC